VASIVSDSSATVSRRRFLVFSNDGSDFVYDDEINFDAAFRVHSVYVELAAGNVTLQVLRGAEVLRSFGPIAVTDAYEFAPSRLFLLPGESLSFSAGDAVDVAVIRGEAS